MRPQDRPLYRRERDRLEEHYGRKLTRIELAAIRRRVRGRGEAGDE